MYFLTGGHNIKNNKQSHNEQNSLNRIIKTQSLLHDSFYQMHLGMRDELTKSIEPLSTLIDDTNRFVKEQQLSIYTSFNQINLSMRDELTKSIVPLSTLIDDTNRLIKVQQPSIEYSLFNQISEDLHNQLTKAIAPLSNLISGISDEVAENMKISTERIKDLSEITEKLSEQLSYTYDVDEEELKTAVTSLTQNGYYLHLLNTPRDYINLYEEYQRAENLEEFDDIYTSYLNYDETDVLSAHIEEIIRLVPEGWSDTLTAVNKNIADNDVLKVENVRIYIYLFYSLLEAFLIETVMTLDHKHPDEWQLKEYKRKKKRGAFKTIKNEITEIDLGERQKGYMNHLLDSGNEYFFGKIDDTKVNRNSVYHGYTPPNRIKLVDFYKVIAFLSHWAYYCVSRSAVSELEKQDY